MRNIMQATIIQRYQQMNRTTRANTSKVHIHVSKPFNVILCGRQHRMEGEVLSSIVFCQPTLVLNYFF